jgi:RNA recognition motif-containing protein
MSSTDPSQTLYIKGLPEKVRVEGKKAVCWNDGYRTPQHTGDRWTKSRSTEIKASLYTLFLSYGDILDIVIMKSNKMRGQAFVVFEEISAATAALRSLNGFSFYDNNIVSMEWGSGETGKRQQWDEKEMAVGSERVHGSTGLTKQLLLPIEYPIRQIKIRCGGKIRWYIQA